MVLIYRGMGILVPIIFFITGWIVSFWFKDTRLGNPHFIGWTSFYTAIVCLLLGIGTFGSEEKDHYGNPIPKKKHDFFFIPIIVWALILGGLSAYLLLSGGEKKEEVVKQKVAEVETPVIHFYNPTNDTLDYLIYTKDGVSDQQALEPYTSVRVKTPEKSYVLGALNTSGKATMTLPYYEDYDAKLYEKVKDGDRTIEQRRIRPLSKEPNDYEDNWFLLDGTYDLILVDATELYDVTIAEDKIAKIDWMKKMKSRHVGSELIELKIAPSTTHGSVYVSAPNTYLPVTNSKDCSVYVLIAVGQHEEVTNDFIKQSIEPLIM